MIRKELLDMLCCPKCKGNLDYKSAENKLVCRSCGHVYDVKDDIPIMLVDDSSRS